MASATSGSASTGAGAGARARAAPIPPAWLPPARRASAPRRATAHARRKGHVYGCSDPCSDCAHAAAARLPRALCQQRPAHHVGSTEGVRWKGYPSR